MSKRKPSQASYGIKGLTIEKFRAMENLDIELGQRVTVIAGQNGTSKSTILGMLGQPFGMKNAHTIFDKTFSTKFTDIFNMSPEHDEPGTHLYYVDFRDETISPKHGQHVQVKSFGRPEKDKSHIRIVTGSTRGKGDGNIDYPVIYQGLKRTYPVGEFVNPKASATNFSNEEIENFKRWYSRVIFNTGENLNPVRMSLKGQKDTLLVNTEEYDYLANSAGQDNLGQLLGAIISFQRIRNHLGDEYRGGLLLIDEFDATLFPSSQSALFDLVYELAPELKLQVVFTTHSLHLIERALEMARKEPNEVSVIYLKKRDSKINRSINPPMDEITADLLIEPLPVPKDFKVDIWCEDDEARWLLGQMLPSKLKKKCKLITAGLGCGELGELSVKDIDTLRYVLFVVDADSNKGARKQIRDCNKRFVLPGSYSSPEESIYEMLLELPDGHPFYETHPQRYSKQMVVKRYEEGLRKWQASGGGHVRKYNKAWLKKEKSEGLWGKNGAVVFALWKDKYASEVEAFCSALEKRVDGMIRRHEYDVKSQV